MCLYIYIYISIGICMCLYFIICVLYVFYIGIFIFISILLFLLLYCINIFYIYYYIFLLVFFLDWARKAQYPNTLSLKDLPSPFNYPIPHLKPSSPITTKAQYSKQTQFLLAQFL